MAEPLIGVSILLTAEEIERLNAEQERRHLTNRTGTIRAMMWEIFLQRNTANAVTARRTYHKRKRV